MNEPDRTIACPCEGKDRDKLARWIDRINQRHIPAEYVFGIFCIINASQKANAWREEHDPGADEWRWAMNRAYRDPMVNYAGPPPRALPAYGPAVAIAPRNERRLACELADEIQAKGFNKVTKARLQLAIEEFLKKHREHYVDSFVTWFSNMDVYRVVVRERVETVNMVVRTGPASSDIHEVPIPKPDYEVHFRHLAPTGDREPTPVEALMVMLTRDLDGQAIDSAKRRRNA